VGKGKVRSRLSSSTVRRGEKKETRGLPDVRIMKDKKGSAVLRCIEKGKRWDAGVLYKISEEGA